MLQPPPPGPYREVTLPAILLGVFFGVMLVACFTYAGLLIGFTIGGSAVAAILGFGVLRGVMRTGSIVENNINQTIASGINITTAGIIFTVPAFYLMDVEFNPVLVGVAAVAGALLGIFFIIPIRKQMIDLDRLRFPTGTAVAAILKSPGAGVEKSRLLVIGMAISAAVMGPFSQGERYLNRAWSAATDRHVAEAVTYVRKAAPVLEEAQREFRRVMGGGNRGSR